MSLSRVGGHPVFSTKNNRPTVASQVSRLFVSADIPLNAFDYIFPCRRTSCFSTKNNTPTVASQVCRFSVSADIPFFRYKNNTSTVASQVCRFPVSADIPFFRQKTTDRRSRLKYLAFSCQRTSRFFDKKQHTDGRVCARITGISPFRVRGHFEYTPLVYKK